MEKQEQTYSLLEKLYANVQLGFSEAKEERKRLEKKIDTKYPKDCWAREAHG